MESDLILQIINQIKYPIIYRHDRSIYKDNPQLDPLQLLKNCTIAAFVGYWVGKFNRRRELLFTSLFTLPFILKYIYDQSVFSKQLKNYDSLTMDASRLKSFSYGNTNYSNKTKIITNSNRTIIRKLPILSYKIYNAHDFVKQLGAQYFK